MKTSTLLAGALTMTIGAAGYALMGGSALLSDSDRGPITRTDLAQATTENAYDIVSRLRPDWITQGSMERSREHPAVYVEIPCNEVSCLRWLKADQIEEVRFLAPDDAGDERPRPHGSGAIMVTLRTRELGTDPGLSQR
ncbi:MAG: hypothetical protein P8X82_19290 [Gemmatimonadales bacterium]